MKQLPRLKPQVWIIAASSLVSVVAIAVGVLFYGVAIRQWDGPAMRAVAGALHLPAARVGSIWIPYTTYLAHLDAEKRFLAGPAAKSLGLPNTVTSDVRSQAYERAIRIAVLETIAKEKDVQVTPLDVDRAYDDLIAQAGTSTTPLEIQNFLNDQFGWGEKDFKFYVVRPALMEDILNAQETKNTGDAQAFQKELDDRMQAKDVVRYLRFSP